MASKVATKEITGRLTESLSTTNLGTRIEQAKIIVEHLAHLKGAAMKAGQLLSLDTSDFLPPEAIEILSRLQAAATPTDTDAVKRVLLTELGKEKYGHVRRFSEAPLASASIGQVHKAEIDMKPVAIKIQYPGVADSIDTDLAILKTLAHSFIKVSGKKINLDETFAEVREVLQKETDYLWERNNLERYRQSVTALNVINDDYILPDSLPDYSTSRVLTMSYEEGQLLADWMASSPPLIERERVAKLVLNLFCKEFVEWGLVQTDPNFGNFLIRGRPPQLVLLDFGATLDYSEEFRKGYSALLRDLTSNDVDRVFKSALNFDLLDPREDREVQVAFKDMITVSLEPFDRNRQPFRFTDLDFEKRTREANMRFSRALVYSPPPKKLIFLHRKLGGIFNLVKRMGVTIDLRPYWAQMTSL